MTIAAWSRDLGASVKSSMDSAASMQKPGSTQCATVVKAAEYGSEIDVMLKDVPIPPCFHPSSIPNLHLTTSRYSVGKAVGGAVACE
jgi:hypothetical protein